MAVLDAFFACDLVGKVVVIFLFGASLVLWTTMVYKWMRLRSAHYWDSQMRNAYGKRPHPAAYFVETNHGAKFIKGVPAIAVYKATMEEIVKLLSRASFGDEQILACTPEQNGPVLSESLLATARARAESELSEQLASLESRMSWLSIGASAAPSIGLFGTVWGIMNAFMSMVAGGSAGLIQNVAPGIASALLTTVVGLLVSIPSAIGYSILFEKVKAEQMLLENFTDKLLADIVHYHGPRAATPVTPPPAPAERSFY